MNTKAVEIARTWIGTPYLHQASEKGAGCDCLGLLRGVWRALYGAEPEAIPAYTSDWSEPQRTELLFAAATRHLRNASCKEPEAGQVILFRMHPRAVAKHVGVLSDTGDLPRFIHAYQGHGVVESPLSGPWQKRIVARFEFIERSV